MLGPKGAYITSALTAHLGSVRKAEGKQIGWRSKGATFGVKPGESGSPAPPPVTYKSKLSCLSVSTHPRGMEKSKRMDGWAKNGTWREMRW